MDTSYRLTNVLLYTVQTYISQSVCSSITEEKRGNEWEFHCFKNTAPVWMFLCICSSMCATFESASNHFTVFTHNGTKHCLKTIKKKMSRDAAQFTTIIWICLGGCVMFFCNLAYINSSNKTITLHIIITMEIKLWKQ